eukprot:COSAG05_NODE_14051_length_409_cov_1.574194_2_plen_34_part_01
MAHGSAAWRACGAAPAFCYFITPQAFSMHRVSIT